MENCKHNYVYVARHYQEVDSNYESNGSKHYEVLNKEKIIIFCTKCGDYKELKSQ